MKFEIEIKKYGKKAILLSWPQKIEISILNDILSVKELIQKKLKEVIDINNGYASLLLLFSRKVTDADFLKIKEILNKKTQSSANRKNNLWKIPVCYHLSLGTDLENFSKTKKLSVDEIIQLHTKPIYKVYCKGFLPGFMYLGGLNKRLNIPRKSIPELRIPKNSVAIGGEQTGVYPIESPGGWHIIGRTPIQLFSVKNVELSLVKAGDNIQFYSVSFTEFLAIESEKRTLKSLQEIE